MLSLRCKMQNYELDPIELKKRLVVSQKLLDEGVELVTGLQERLIETLNEIRIHKQKTEASLHAITNHDLKLWSILDKD